MTEQVGGGGEVVAERHPVADFTDRLLARLEGLRESPVPVWSMGAEDKRHTLMALATAQAELEALRLEVLLAADRDEAAIDAGDRSAADWAARVTRQTRASARADLTLAEDLEDRYPVVGAGVRAGAVRVDQARAIVRGLRLLPTSGKFAVDADQRRQAEEHLVDLADAHDAKALEQLARSIYSVICPEHADDYEGRLLEAEEARAARKVTLEMHEDHQGVVHGRFRLPKLHGHMLRKQLQAIMSPLRADAADTCAAPGERSERDTRPVPVRRGEALCELIERTSARDLPQTGGGDATVIVTMTLADLLHRLNRAGVATLDTGARISAAEARRLACHHRVVPMVLGGDSVVLDQGRSKRLHTKQQRLALYATQTHCSAEHCDVPASMCQAHHDVSWQHGGRTDTTTGRLLCGQHHRRLHDPGIEHRISADGKVELHRRT
ncbi:HNH endonuclease signature motif containing protein [Nocardioides aequoreus]|uniref:HNH endonuclease signature motif containing protein n=1 Tax=Nocardioides aequoreus TaxID=397278 RepID=UPI0004C33111|nr:HNH endonuclease signature motif containing protein [Nocardioides aequoreus]